MCDSQKVEEHHYPHFPSTKYLKSSCNRDLLSSGCFTLCFLSRRIWSQSGLKFYSHPRNGLNLSKAFHAEHVLTRMVCLWHAVAEGYNRHPNAADFVKTKSILSLVLEWLVFRRERAYCCPACCFRPQHWFNHFLSFTGFKCSLKV